MRTNDHYVNNKEFLEQMINFKKEMEKAEKEGLDKPRIPDEIGLVFVKIATHLSFKSNFINYGFREDMISDGIENCIQYIHNFNPDKSRNPFAYFTQIIYYAFLRRIQKEKKHLYVKYKTLENSQIMDDSMVDKAPDASNMTSVGHAKLYDNMSEFIGNFEESMQKKKNIKNKQRKMTSLKKGKTRKKNTVLQHATNLNKDE
jgi:hypothetical protein